MNQLEYLLSRTITTSTGCMEWQGSTHYHGYGTCTFKGNQYYVHRLVWELFYGTIPKGIHILHKCDNPPCINPKHLFSGTHQTNMIDMVSKGRNKHSKFIKLTESDLNEIHILLHKKIIHRIIANKFNVTRSYISLIAKKGKFV